MSHIGEELDAGALALGALGRKGLGGLRVASRGGLRVGWCGQQRPRHLNQISNPNTLPAIIFASRPHAHLLDVGVEGLVDLLVQLGVRLEIEARKKMGPVMVSETERGAATMRHPPTRQQP